MAVKKILLAGYIGCGNIGDDAMALGLLHGLHEDAIDVAVLSGNPENTYNNYKVHSIPRKDLGLVDKAIDACDVLVFPGGSIFQDATSVRSVGYYWRLVSRAKKKGKKVALLAQGVGPLTTFLGKKMATSAFKAADSLTVRDPGSVAALKTLGIDRSVRVTADPAFLLPEPSNGEVAEAFSVGGMKSVGLAPRPVKGVDVVSLFGELAQLIFKSGSVPVLIEMDRNEDGPLIQAIRDKQGGKIPDLRKIATPWNLQQRLARMDSVIAMRLHAGVLAATVGVPTMFVSYDPKVDAIARLLNLPGATPVAKATASGLLAGFQRFSADRDRHAAEVLRKRDELRKLASGNIAVLRDVLRGA